MTFKEKWARIDEIDAEYDRITKRQAELSKEKNDLLMVDTGDNPHRRKRRPEVTMRELRKHYV